MNPSSSDHALHHQRGHPTDSGQPESGYSTSESVKPKKLKYRKLQKLLSRRKANVYYGDCSPFAHDPPGHTAGLPCCERLDKETHVLETPHYPSACVTPLSGCHSNFSITRGDRKLLHGKPMFSGGNFSLRAVKGMESLATKLGDPDVEQIDKKKIANKENEDGETQNLENFAMTDNADDFVNDPYYTIVPVKGDKNCLKLYAKRVPDSNTVIRSVKSAITHEQNRGDSGISLHSNTGDAPSHNVYSYHVYAALPVDSKDDSKPPVGGVSNRLYDVTTELDLNLEMFSCESGVTGETFPANLQALFVEPKLTKANTSETEETDIKPRVDNLDKPKQKLSPLKMETKSLTVDNGVNQPKRFCDRNNKDKKSSSDATNGEDSSSEYEDAEVVIRASATSNRHDGNTISGVQIVHSPLQPKFSAERQDDELSLPPYPNYSDDESIVESIAFPLELDGTPIPPPQVLNMTAMGYKYPPRVNLGGAPSSIGLKEMRERFGLLEGDKERNKWASGKLKLPPDPKTLGYSYPPTNTKIIPPPVNRAVKPAALKTSRFSRTPPSEYTSDSSGGKLSSGSSPSSDGHAYDNALAKGKSKSLPITAHSPSIGHTEPTSLSDTSPDESDADLDVRFERVNVDPVRRFRSPRQTDITRKLTAKKDDSKSAHRSSATFPRRDTTSDNPITLIL